MFFFVKYLLHIYVLSYPTLIDYLYMYFLEQLAADPDLTDVDAVTSELRNIRAQQQKIVNLTNSSLNQGITNENVAQTTTALQVNEQTLTFHYYSLTFYFL